MIGNVIFYIYFILSYFLLSFVLYYNWIGVLQFEGYYLGKLITSRFNVVKKNFLVYLMYAFLLILAIVFYKYFDVVLSIFFLIVEVVALIVFYIKQMKYNCLVFTKRIGRLIVPILLIEILLLYIIIKYLSISIISIAFYVLVSVNFLILLMAYFICKPIEKMVANHYIKLAKNKLSSNKQLIKIGITGSYGKTSVKEILSSILSLHYNVLSTPKSYNTPFGITKTINSRLTNLIEVFVCEMGAKKSGEILELCNLVEVGLGIVTAVGNQHSETFGSVENIYKTKKELPDYLQNKLCVFNLMNPYTRKMYLNYVGNGIGCFVINESVTSCCRKVKKKLKCIAIKDNGLSSIYYNYPKKNNYYAKINKMTENGTDFTVYCGCEKLGELSTSLLGEHNVINIVMAVSMAMQLGVSFDKVRKGVMGLNSIQARLEKFVTPKGAIVINNGYNSNINSARSSLRVLKLFKNKIKVVITPGLVETNDDFRYNREFGKMVSLVADEVIIVKEKNKDAIMLGLSDSCFDMSKVYLVKSFSDAGGVINVAGDNYVFLIENDLPNFYK